MKAVQGWRCLERQPTIERLLRAGAGCLTVGELLMVAAGLAEEDTRQLVLALGDDTGAGLRQVDAERLLGYGLTARRAAVVLAAVELGRRAYLAPGERQVLDNPQAVAAALGADFAFSGVEQFVVLLLDVKNRLVAQRIISVGTLDETIAHPREVFREAVRQGAATVIVADNHPSGECSPSPQDLQLTRQLIECGRTLQIPVLDHVIVGPYCWNSLRRTTGLW